MEQQHSRIMRSRDRSQAEFELMEDIERAASILDGLIVRIGQHIDDQHIHATACRDITEMERLQQADPIRWQADARHSLQSGVMFALRAVEQPSAF